eukprot:1187660-Amphidinium_carterae.1
MSGVPRGDWGSGWVLAAAAAAAAAAALSLLFGVVGVVYKLRRVFGVHKLYSVSQRCQTVREKVWKFVYAMCGQNWSLLAKVEIG